MAESSSPLKGVRVLDLTRLLPGPWATWILSAMGAEIVKLEAPGAGDYSRFVGPMVGDASALFHVLNRGKRSLVLDLKKPGAREVVLELVGDFDVVVEQFRPGVLARLGLSWEELQSANPDLILCSLTGYGQDGPLAAAAGHDLNYQALVGSLWLGGQRGGAPPVPAIPFADIFGAQDMVSAILAALFQRERGGGGTHLDVSITEAMGAAAAPLVATWTAEGDSAPGRGEALLGGGIAQYSVYRTSCGGYLAVAALEPKFFALFADAVGRPEWKSQLPLPGPHQEPLRQEIADLLSSRSRDEWVELLSDVDCCVSPVLDPAEASAGEHFAARGVAGTAADLGSPAHWVETSLGPRSEGLPPSLGEHSDEILSEAGYSSEAIAELREAGVVA